MPGFSAMALHLHSLQETALTVAETLCPCVHHAVFSMEVRTRPIPLCTGPHRLCQAQPSPAQPSPGYYSRSPTVLYGTVSVRYGTVFGASAVPPVRAGRVAQWAGGSMRSMTNGCVVALS